MRWAFPVAPPERLAALRILVALFAVVYLTTRAGIYLSLRDADPARFAPVGVLSFLDRPVDDASLTVLYAVAVVTGVAAVLGVAYRLVGPVFAVGLLLLSTYRSSWGQILWLENVMVVQVLVVGFSPAGDALRWPRRAHGDPACAPSEAYGVPLRLAAVVTVITYLLAALAKVRYGGVAWFTSDSLRNHVAASVARAELLDAPASPLGRWLVRYAWVFPPMAVASFALELAAPLALVGGRVRDVWVGLTWAMHVAVALLMYVVFPYPLFLVAFAPFYDLETFRLPRWVPRPRGRA